MEQPDAEYPELANISVGKLHGTFTVANMAQEVTSDNSNQRWSTAHQLRVSLCRWNLYLTNPERTLLKLNRESQQICRSTPFLIGAF